VSRLSSRVEHVSIRCSPCGSLIIVRQEGVFALDQLLLDEQELALAHVALNDDAGVEQHADARAHPCAAVPASVRFSLYGKQT
jgi:hypothetical protein